MNVLFLQPKSERVPISRTNYSPPLGLMSLGAFLKEKSKAQVTILNGELMTEKDVLRSIEQNNPDVLGISTTVGCYREALHIAKKIKIISKKH